MAGAQELCRNLEAVGLKNNDGNTAKKRVTDILNCLQGILAEVLHMQPLPGEGLERPFRERVKIVLLQGPLGWPGSKLYPGEIYDIYGLDDLNFPVLYVETKSPLIKVLSENDQTRFVEKLVRLGTVEYGALTNGHEWEVYRCTTNEMGKIEVKKFVRFHLKRLANDLRANAVTPSTLEVIKEAFSGLSAVRYLDRDILRILETRSASIRLGPRTKRALETEKYVQSLMRAVLQFTVLFERMFRSYITSSSPVSLFLDRAFNDWCIISGRVPLMEVERLLSDTVDKLHDTDPTQRLSTSSRECKKLSKDLGMTVPPSLLKTLVSTWIVKPSMKTTEKKAVIRAQLLSTVYREYVELFCRQTAHVIVGRILLYRVCEDKQLVERQISGTDLARRIKQRQQHLLTSRSESRLYLEILDEVSRLMETVFYARLYEPNIFDWWRVDPHTRSLDDRQRAEIRRTERNASLVIKEILKELTVFDMGYIDRDIWKDIYQEYLPARERSRLGGFYTPDEMVQLILDLAGYKVDRDDLCNKALLDPACGSGTFLVDAVKRLRLHLENDALSCHAGIRNLDEYDRAKRTIEIIRERIYGFDIHPFAVFLAEMNILLQLVDLLILVRNKYGSFSLPRLHIHRTDSLRQKEDQLDLKLRHFRNRFHRAESFVRETDEATAAKARRFDFVVGNPPWGGVLRGKLSPLFDREAKRYFKHVAKYRSATGKYDIYVLFMERGLHWLPKGGILGLITQNRWRTQQYGEGAKGVLRDLSRPLFLLDLGNIGKVIFPGRTNYPMVSIWEKREDE